MTYLFNHSYPTVFVTTEESAHAFQFNGTLLPAGLNLQTIGLSSPIKGHIQFVDTDFDGQMDLVSVKQGVYLSQNKQFKLTRQWAELITQRKHHFKQLLWFDADINGQWDVVNAVSYPSGKRNTFQLHDYSFKDMKQRDRIAVHRNISAASNWLYVDLHGTSYNQQGIGSRIEVKSKDNTQFRQVWGDLDSIHSQGHYRQYIGL